MGVGGATPARINVRRNQAAQCYAIASRCRNFTGGPGPAEECSNLLPKLRWILFVGETGQCRGPLRIARELLRHRSEALRVSSRTQAISSVQCVDDLLDLLRGQNFTEAPRECGLKVQALI